jgi:phage-related protein
MINSFTVDTVTERLTSPSKHRLWDGAGVKASATAFPSPLNGSTTYYVRVIDNVTIELYDTAAHAIAATTLTTGRRNMTTVGADLTLSTDTIHQTCWMEPSQGLAVDLTPRIRSVQFGEGYDQTSKDGINSNPRTFNVKYNKATKKKAVNVLNFLEDHQEGTKWFYWTPPEPYDDLTKFKCAKWGNSFDGPNVYNVDAVFKQSYEI